MAQWPRLVWLSSSRTLQDIRHDDHREEFRFEEDGGIPSRMKASGELECLRSCTCQKDQQLRRLGAELAEAVR